MKTLFILLLTLICGNVLAQRGRFTEVKSECHLKNDHELKIKCKFTIKINDIENDTLSFVSIQIDADNLSSNNGYIYLSSENELNEFKEELKQGIAKIKTNELFQVANSRYIISVVKDSVAVKPVAFKTVFTPKYRMRLYEVRSGSNKTYMSFYSDVADKLLAWLEGIKF